MPRRKKIVEELPVEEVVVEVEKTTSNEKEVEINGKKYIEVTTETGTYLK